MPLCGISVAPLAQISIYTLSPHQFSLVLYARISIAEGKYRAARHIACAFGANIDLLDYPLIHRRRDGGPPSPQRFFQNRGKVGMSGKPPRRRSARSSAEPPPFRHAFSVPPFPLSGKSTPQSSAKPSGRRLVSDNFQLTEVNDAAAMLCPTRLFDSSGRTIFIDEREGYSSSRTSLAFSAIIAPAEPLVTLPKSKR